MEQQTNVTRLLTAAKIPFTHHSYSHTDAVSAVEVAAVLGQDPRRVFKTLVTTGRSGNHYVFVIPAEENLDLKKAAAAVSEKSIEMLKAKDLIPLTGYIHGGCSPIGMKKRFPTLLHRTAADFPTIFCSAGRIGDQIELAPDELLRCTGAGLADLTV